MSEIIERMFDIIDSLFMKYFNRLSPCKYCLKRPICSGYKDRCEDSMFYILKRRKNVKNKIIVYWSIISIFYFGGCILSGIVLQNISFIYLFAFAGLICFVTSTIISLRFSELMDDLIEYSIKHTDHFDAIRYIIDPYKKKQ